MGCTEWCRKCKNTWTTGKQVQSLEWSWQMRVAYYGFIGLIILGIAGIQVYLTFLSEDSLIAIQREDTCRAVFDGVERGWTETRIFTLAITGNYFSTNFEISQDQHRKFAQTETSWDPFIWGFFPDPEPPRIKAIDTAKETDDLACSGRIDLFGVEEQPAGMLCYAPLWTDSDGNPVAEKAEGSAIYGYVNPVFKFDRFLERVYDSSSFGTDISDVDIWLYDITVEGVANFATGLDGASFLGVYPTQEYGPGDDIASDHYRKRVTESDDYEVVKTKQLSVASRDWTVFCAVKPSYAVKRRSWFPWIIGALSVVFSILESLIAIAAVILIAKASDHISKRRLDSKMRSRVLNANKTATAEGNGKAEAAAEVGMDVRKMEEGPVRAEEEKEHAVGAPEQVEESGGGDEGQNQVEGREREREWEDDDIPSDGEGAQVRERERV
uniref:CHASE domain-containing protein n=1 Tax=Chromera velia CCMP2878 TaxID=1169474 RepID=A0A0G4G303_9ALVE|eukprot:Cvel_20003.t1-p1 / transcript=Cvel_20003.t1 / gene=Cvel_20003 / organism=Chromera_velia_CCMP2878 / gene_product=hypothetical protein / transcript_product=hypothetical protein / location=Cvel_scaffold1763:22482-26746(+) / protein_length=439 / sequence_SO=supercontig / SO=protein_coding / is_pseudo=false